MHWFWRATIAVVGSFVILRGVNLLLYRSVAIATLASWPVVVCRSVVGPALPIALYALMTWLCPGKTGWEHETRCRKCGYILRGITEPRCSECGERI